MVREILFRGKRLDNGKWYYGSYLFLKDAPSYDWTGKASAKGSDVHFIIDEKEVNYAVDPATVGQCSDLTDKNGTRIFEGDIIKNRNGHNCVIKCGPFRPDMFFDLAEEAGFMCPGKLWGWYAEFKHEVACLTETMSDCVIIGNIHDTPELLEP